MFVDERKPGEVANALLKQLKDLLGQLRGTKPDEPPVQPTGAGVGNENQNRLVAWLRGNPSRREVRIWLRGGQRFCVELDDGDPLHVIWGLNADLWKAVGAALDNWGAE